MRGNACDKGDSLTRNLDRFGRGTPNESSLASSVASRTAHFTFVNQAEDLAALPRRKISNQKQRLAIRSHVMQRVRHLELASGKKRKIGRESVKRPEPNKSRGGSSDSDSSPKKGSTPPFPIAIKHKPKSVVPYVHAESEKLPVGARASGHFPLHMAPAIDEFDPFETLPSNRVPHKSVESLLKYCFDVLLPLTFSVETKHARERLARQGMVLQSKISSPATFLGFMATVSAHRAITSGHHQDLSPSVANHDDLIVDPDYKTVKHEAIVAVRRKVETFQKLDQDMVEACFGLISTATVVGNFEEARMHLGGIAQMMELVGVSEGSLKWVPISNVKVSVGLLSRPILPLPWSRQPIPEVIGKRISPAPDSDMVRLGCYFILLEDLSDSLQGLLSMGRDICNFCELNATDPQGLSSLENSVLQRKAIELEYDLLAYPYESNAFRQDRDKEPLLPSLEGVVRLAVLGFLSFTPHTIMPPTGLGRALTHHQKRAVEAWLREKDESCGVSELKVICWALFIFVQNSSKQPEETFFTRLLSRLIRKLWFLSWQDVETTMFGFLYIPKLQSSIWKAIWATSLEGMANTGQSSHSTSKGP
ncbi:uncharacterized protein Z518_08331 [Rhinocladiella mackenziei CBS 650.93]|uniref:Tachykinin family protein n=1 Tax=Rhinocladiella mackenziei CBS 650.93 TaxID=1442369 RepID=A0A0D2J0H6_9EURO|nr:uncharacterized protein Z518_08331 [Rhinocladiella mackenziei CBS 650.93]KIX02390.1 hypothetical protein Z518_08331 [Rhinocladiella mackenziei CBS 650.93]